jgi:hypothetical protein
MACATSIGSNGSQWRAGNLPAWRADSSSITGDAMPTRFADCRQKNVRPFGKGKAPGSVLDADFPGGGGAQVAFVVPIQKDRSRGDSEAILRKTVSLLREAESVDLRSA